MAWSIQREADVSGPIKRPPSVILNVDAANCFPSPASPNKNVVQFYSLDQVGAVIAERVPALPCRTYFCNGTSVQKWFDRPSAGSVIRSETKDPRLHREVAIKIAAAQFTATGLTS